MSSSGRSTTIWAATIAALFFGTNVLWSLPYVVNTLVFINKTGRFVEPALDLAWLGLNCLGTFVTVMWLWRHWHHNEEARDGKITAAEMPRSDSQAVRWTRYPLIALAIVSYGPSVMTPILYLTLRLFGVRELSGTEIFFNWDTYESILFFPIFFALSNWPFIVLYNVCKRKVKEEWPDVRSVHLAMWFSLVAMVIPNLPFFYGTPEELISAPPGSGAGTGIALPLLLWIPVPILGIVGWFAGLFFAWLREEGHAVSSQHSKVN